MLRRSGLAVALVLVLAPAADAHFLLNAPASMSEQDSFGAPQKSAPCGLSDRPGVADESVPTGIVTTVQAGTTLTIRIRETIFPPGHYRVALAPTQSMLPADPPVTPGSTPCGSTTIDPAPTLPVLADGQLVHTTSPGNREQTIDVQIPAGMTCTSCVLQVTQFMSNHDINNPGGCYYHHCAIVNITADPPTPDAGTGPGDPDDGGGCCGTSANPALAAGLAALVLATLSRRRRARD
jgi:hypothetical protein